MFNLSIFFKFYYY